MSDPLQSPVDRRTFLGHVAAGLGLTAVVAACGGGGESGSVSTAGAVTVDPATCEGYAALTEQDLQLRRNLGYVDETIKPESYCTNCRFQNAMDGSPCVGCQLFQGPVSPGGYCNSWAAAV